MGRVDVSSALDGSQELLELRAEERESRGFGTTGAEDHPLPPYEGRRVDHMVGSHMFNQNAIARGSLPQIGGER